MKKIISIILAAAMILSLGVMGISAVDEQTISGEDLNVKLEAGASFDYKVSITDNLGMAALKFVVGFNKDVLELTKIAIGEVMPNNGTNTGNKGIEKANSNGEVAITLGDDLAEENFTDNGVLATLTFSVKDAVDPGKYDLTVFARNAKSDIKNVDLESVATAFVDGSVNLYGLAESVALNIAAPAKNGTPVTAVEGTEYNGTITWSPADNIFKAETVYTANVALTPKAGYQFADGLTATVNGNAATVSKSESGVIVSYTFPATEGKVLQGIEITNQPTKTEYIQGDVIDTAGLEVTASYDDSTTAVVTGWTISPETAEAAGSNTITVTYEGKTATFTVNAAKNAVKSIAVTTLPTKTTYELDEALDTTGMVVTATYANGNTAAVTGYTFAPATFTVGGEVDVTVTYVNEDGTFNAPTFKVTVTKKDAKASDFTISGNEVTYTGLDQFSGITVNPNDAAVGTVTVRTFEAINAGEYDIVVDTTGSDTYNAGTFTVGKLVISKAAATVTAENKTAKYNEDIPELTYTVTGLVNNETASVVTVAAPATEAVKGSDVGTYDITIASATADNYEVAIVKGTLTIEKADYVASDVESTVRYGKTGTAVITLNGGEGSIKSNSNATIFDSVTIDGATLTFAVKDDEALVDQTAEIVVTVSGKNYNDYDVKVTVTVKDLDPADLTLAEIPEKTYGTDKEFNLSVNVANKGEGTGVYAYASDNESVATVDENGKVTIVGAGTATIKATYTSESTYGEDSKTLTVKKAQIAVAAKDVTVYLNGTFNPANAYTVTGDAEQVDVTVQIKDNATVDTTVEGEYDFTVVANLKDSANYELTVEPAAGKIKVMDMPIIIVPIARYNVTVAETENGTVTPSTSSATSGATITLTVKPDEGYLVDEVKVEGAEVKAAEDGTYTFVMPEADVTVTVTFKPEKELHFVDVADDAWSREAIYWAARDGITNGVDETHFAPTGTATRAQMVTFLWRLADKPAAQGEESPFTDVDANEYYAEAVQWAVDNGITTGKSSGIFAPNENVTRAQVVMMLWRMANKPAATITENPFEDVDSDSVYCAAILWAYEKGITNGVDATHFAPNSDVTREQVAAFIYRYATAK